MKLLSSWDAEYPLSESLSICRKLALAHVAAASATASPHFELPIIKRALLSSDWEFLCKHDLSYSTESEGATPLSVYHLRQSLAFFSKNPEIDIGVNRDEVAFAKFMESESMCRETNSLFKLWSRGEFSFHPDVESSFFLAQRKIASVLGELPPLSEVGLRFGPGSTTSTKKRLASVREKLHARLACSEELAPYAQCIFDELPLWANLCEEVSPMASHPVHVEQGKVTFVPKSAKTNRAVVTEPVLNGMLQLGYGDIISKRLRAVGVDTRDQTLNQRLALEGSRSGALATLDLSSASDTISTELVFNLLPLDWALALSHARTRKVTLRGETITQEKFSSMGNGYTFPLETLIFWALAKSCCKGTEVVSVYGDDIIVPAHRSEAVVRLLHCAGFSVNTAKSYATGPFRESCGKDYFWGFDIRPNYQKSLVGPATLFVLHNFYVRRGLDDFAEMVRRLISPSLQIFGPDGYGDGHLLGDWQPRPHKRNIGYSGYLFDTFTWKARRDVRPAMPGDYVVPYYQVYVRDPCGDPKYAERPLRFAHGDPTLSTPVSGFTFPGKKGYKRISIYTLNRG